MKEKLNGRLLGPDLRPQSSGPSREVQTASNPFETTATAFTHMVSELARRLVRSDALHLLMCVKRPGSGFFFSAEDADTASCRRCADSLFFHPP